MLIPPPGFSAEAANTGKHPGNQASLSDLAHRFPLLADELSHRATFEPVLRSSYGGSVTGFSPRTAPRSEPPGGIDLFFPNRYSDPFLVQTAGIRLSLQCLNARDAVAEITDGKVIYREAFQATDSLHVVSGAGGEEFLVLRDSSAPREFQYRVRTSPNVDVSLLPNQFVRIINFKGDELFIEPPRIVDGNNRWIEGGAVWELNKLDPGLFRLTLKIRSRTIKFPAVVDPKWKLARRPSIYRASRYSSTLLSDGRVLVVGGVGDSGRLDSAEIYDPASDPILLADARVLAISRLFNSTQLYDPVTGAWRMSTVLCDGSVLVAGGRGSDFYPVHSAELFDPATGQWALVGQLNHARYYHAATLLSDRRVMVTGGEGSLADPDNEVGGLVPLTTAEIYDPVSKTWTEAEGDLIYGRRYHIAELLETKVLVAGGGKGDFDTGPGGTASRGGDCCPTGRLGPSPSPNS